MKMVRVTWNDAATYDCTFNSESFGLVKSWPAQSRGVVGERDTRGSGTRSNPLL